MESATILFRKTGKPKKREVNNMIYPTLKECIDACSKTGVLKVEAMKNEEYVMHGAGFKPRYSRSMEKALAFFPCCP